MKFGRRKVQWLSAFLTNSYFKALFPLSIYQGKLKFFCHPGLNCYSCPLAFFSCPIGALQVIAGSRHFFSFYIIGFLGLIGSFVGRFVCGWICPFGLLQELLYKIKSFKIKINSSLCSIKYFVLFFVITLPLFFSQAEQWFCRFICPQGTLQAGLPFILFNSELRINIGISFWIKIFFLLTFLFLMIIAKRPFCRIICPLGAFYGFFNRFSLYQIEVDKDKCNQCDWCYQNCPVEIKIYTNPKSRECIRCLKCLECPLDAVKLTKNHGSRRDKIQKSKLKGQIYNSKFKI